MSDFKDKVAIVTGAGQGIGFEICRQLIREGAYVYLNDINAELAGNAAVTLNKMEPGRAHAFAGDSGDKDFILSMIHKIVEKQGKLDIAIANAGITLFGQFLEYTERDFNRVIQVNLSGTFFLAQAAAVQMKKQKTGGSILFTSSVTGHVAHKGLVVYGMTKAAIETLARNLVIELAPFGINVNTVAPGATMTERTAQDKDYKEVWGKITPDGKVGSVSDVANAVLFFVNEKSKHITGQNLIVDGGWSSVGIQPS